MKYIYEWGRQENHTFEEFFSDRKENKQEDEEGVWAQSGRQFVLMLFLVVHSHYIYY